MEKRKVRFGIIGYGFMGHNHARSLAKLDNAEVTAVCDNNEKQLYDIPEGAKVYGQMDDLIGDPNIDAVIVSVPNHIHLETVSKAARAGKDILCEKPAALSVAEFDKMMEAWAMYILYRQSCMDLTATCMTGMCIRSLAAACCMTGAYTCWIRWYGWWIPKLSACLQMCGT